jgi:hypothetical protein
VDDDELRGGRDRGRHEHCYREGEDETVILDRLPVQRGAGTEPEVSEDHGGDHSGFAVGEVHDPGPSIHDDEADAEQPVYQAHEETTDDHARHRNPPRSAILDSPTDEV